MWTNQEQVPTCPQALAFLKSCCLFSLKTTLAHQQTCPAAKPLKLQDKIALFTKMAALYYDYQFERLK
jgi:hypothetical protein